ncbi:holin-associated N-acetylmuramidase [Gemmobacter denitrificans]|uniref:Holin-associated N-acetylmuramidase n=1 Tax=Gemmobacter denitrificans TaxID=3123040 RepID=A0ABU8BR94_9RHOB
MKHPRDIAREIVAREGGYVNDPADPGGATNYGVTIHTMRRLALDLTGDGRVGIDDVKRLTRDQAVEIFLRDYFEKPGIDRLPRCLQASVFDMYVNAGANAVKILQRLLTDLGWPLVADGVIGPKTALAAAQAAEAMPGTLADAYGVARRDYYYGLADARPASRKYARRRDGGKGGWIVRAEEFISPHFHLTEAQHRARTARWG